MYVCTVFMAGYPSVSCNRIIENKRNKTKKRIAYFQCVVRTYDLNCVENANQLV